MSRPFIVLASARKGTHLLLTALARHPDIRSFGQPFGNADFFPEDSGHTLAARLFDDVAPVAVIALAGPPDTHPGFWDELLTSRVGVIYLHRRNMLRRLVSTKIALATQTWIAYTQPPPATVQVTVDPNAAIAEIEDDWRRERELRDAFKGHKTLHLWYEDLTARFDAEIVKVQAFMDVPIHLLRPTCWKQQTLPLTDVIANYPALREAWEGTPWEWFLRDDCCQGVLPAERIK